MAGEREVGVVVWGRRFLWAPAEIRTVVAHEAGHAHLAASVGSKERYEAIAPWFREGLAIWFSGEGPGALDAAVALAAFSEGRSDRCLRGIPLADAGAGEASRADAALAFAWLEARTGTDGVRALVRAVARGASLDDALWSLVGLAPPAFRASVLAWGRARVEARLEPGREARFVESLRWRDQGRVAEAAARWRDLVREDPDGPLRDTLAYLLARHALGEEPTAADGDRIESSLRVVLGSGSTLWRAEALVLLGELRAVQGRSAEAVEAWTTVLEAHWDEPGPVRQARRALADTAVDPSR